MTIKLIFFTIDGVLNSESSLLQNRISQRYMDSTNPWGVTDLDGACIQRLINFANTHGYGGTMALPSWRNSLFSSKTITKKLANYGLITACLSGSPLRKEAAIMKTLALPGYREWIDGSGISPVILDTNRDEYKTSLAERVVEVSPHRGLTKELVERASQLLSTGSWLGAKSL